MGNMMCCEQNNPKYSQRKERGTKDQVNYPNQIQPTYYTNPATKDEDFTFNDKIKMQSYMNKYEVNYVPNFIDGVDSNWYGAAQALIVDINRINTDPEWSSTNTKSGLELIYSQKDEKIFFGSKQMTAKQISQSILNITQNNPFAFANETATTTHENHQSFRNSNIPNSFQNNNGPLSNPDLMRNKSKESFQQQQQQQGPAQNRTSRSNSTKQMCVNTIKLEFEANCSAEKMLKGLTNLKKYTNKIQKQTVIESSQNKEFSVSHIIFSKQMQKVQRDLVVANYYTDIGPNLNNCYASVNHYNVPEITDIVRAQIIKGGHTFFEQYETAEEKLTSSNRKQQNNGGNQENLKNSQLHEENTTFQNNTHHNNHTAFGSMNLNIGQVKTKVRFYGEFYCKSTFDENVVRMVFLTEFREYIAICKNIAMQESVTSSEFDGESMDKEAENTVDMDHDEN